MRLQGLQINFVQGLLVFFFFFLFLFFVCVQLGFPRNIDVCTHSPPSVDRIGGIWGSYYSITKAIFYLLKGE